MRIAYNLTMRISKKAAVETFKIVGVVIFLYILLKTILIPLIPILWIISPSPIYLIFVPAVISGVSWAGFNLATGNFIYDNVSVQRRGLAVSYYNMANGIGIFLGAGLGAILIKFLTISFIEPVLLIFLIGGIARMIVVFIWMPKIREIRKTAKFHGNKAVRNLIFKQAKPALIESIHEVMSLKEYFRKSRP